ncbi:MAG: hypothetical protein RIT28_1605 [Pseudomonadota bacterium]
MRVAHLTDLHVMRPPSLGELTVKRLLGSANLYVMGRNSHFTEAAQQAAVAAVARLNPDALLCSGDLTAQALPAEFEAAAALLTPLFSRQPTALIPGNHDTYTPDTFLNRTIEERFGQWTGKGDWPRLHLLGDAVACVALDVCRAQWILSSGFIDEGQLDGLDTLLRDDRLRGRFVFVMLHYPLRNRRGEPYGPATRNLENAATLEALLLKHAGRVGAVVHGHEHHGFRSALQGDGVQIPILNPGAAGYAYLPKKGRTAHLCVYTVEDGALRDVERLRFDGQDFVPEPGGAWASGG